MDKRHMFIVVTNYDLMLIAPFVAEHDIKFIH